MLRSPSTDWIPAYAGMTEDNSIATGAGMTEGNCVDARAGFVAAFVEMT
jgi:hypothetical protein